MTRKLLPGQGQDEDRPTYEVMIRVVFRSNEPEMSAQFISDQITGIGGVVEAEQGEPWEITSDD